MHAFAAMQSPPLFDVTATAAASLDVARSYSLLVDQLAVGTLIASAWVERVIAMKIAIPTFGTRVSPRFDYAQSVLIVTIDEAGAAERQEITATDWAPHERINRLLELGVETVICGGIDRWSAASLQSAGVTIYALVVGEAEDALSALLQGKLDTEAALAGNSRCACRRFAADDDPSTSSPGPGQGIRGRGGRGGRGRGGGRGCGGGPPRS